MPTATTARRTRSAGSTAPKRRTCGCKAYPWPHRPGGGHCRGSEPPTSIYEGEGGKNAPNGMRTNNSAIRRRLMKRYALHPIRDRELVRRFLPKLYAAYCRRYGYPYPEWWMRGYVPAMRITAEGPRAPNAPAPLAVPPGYRFGSWYAHFDRERRRKPMRCVERRRRRPPSNLSVSSAEQYVFAPIVSRGQSERVSC